MPKYAIIKELPNGFSMFDLPRLLTTEPPPTTRGHELRAAAELYVEMTEFADKIGAKIEPYWDQ